MRWCARTRTIQRRIRSREGISPQLFDWVVGDAGQRAGRVKTADGPQESCAKRLCSRGRSALALVLTVLLGWEVPTPTVGQNWGLTNNTVSPLSLWTPQPLALQPPPARPGRRARLSGHHAGRSLDSWRGLRDRQSASCLCVGVSERGGVAKCADASSAARGGQRGEVLRLALAPGLHA